MSNGYKNNLGIKNIIFHVIFCSWFPKSCIFEWVWSQDMLSLFFPCSGDKPCNSYSFRVKFRICWGEKTSERECWSKPCCCVVI